MESRFLCRQAEDPAGAPDKVFIDCRIEEGSFAPGPAPPDPAELHVVAWNLERGMHLDRQLALLQTHPDLRRADLILASEADRGCSRTNGRNVARELAEGLGMHYAFGVQYVELPRQARRAVNRIERTCEHGNVILSRYPLEELRLLQHSQTTNWYEHPGEPRLGGCTTLVATLRLGSRSVRLYSVHLDSGWKADARRSSQAAELVADAEGAGGPVIVGGDMNTYRYTADVVLGTRIDPTPPVFLGAGYQDAHAGLPALRRGTTGRHYVVRGVIDLVFTRGARASAAGIVRARGLSDHFPVWARLSLD